MVASETAWDVIGHEWAIELLRRSLAREHVSHAYLFLGPPQIGKTRMAQELARALICTGEQPVEDAALRMRPCGVCDSCRKARAGVHPDIRVVERDGPSLKIEQIRTLQHDAALTPVEGRYKIFLLLDLERATPDAANCLLKTLEEPPASVILILTASEADLLLPTVVSRCQVLSLRPVPLALLARTLRERFGLDEPRAALLARLSGGRPGWAISAQEDEDVLALRADALDALVGAFRQDLVERWRLAEKMSTSDTLRDQLDVWLSWWRDALLQRAGRADSMANVDRRVELATVAPLMSVAQIAAQAERVRATIRWLGQNVNARLALETLLMDLPSLKTLPMPGAP